MELKHQILLSVLMAVVLTVQMADASSQRAPVAAEMYHSCFFNALDHTYTIRPGKLSDAFAYGFFDDTYEENGAGHLYLWTNSKYADRQQMSCAGYLEGFLSGHRIKDFYRSYRESTYPSEELYERIARWVEASLSWTLDSVLNGENSSPYWNVVGLSMTQLLSMVEGYNARIKDFPLSTLDFFLMNSIGDMDDLIPAMNYTMHKEKMKGGKAEKEGEICSEPWCVMTAQANSHCSAIIKPINGILYSAHEMWASYCQMLMVWKQYDFGFRHTPEIVSHQIAFSSWPGLLSSEDDFYITGTKLVVMETTNNVYNLSLYDRIKPQSLLSWVRAITANYMATTPDQWHKIFKLYNSGTYNNQWMVSDMKAPFGTQTTSVVVGDESKELQRASNRSLVAGTVMIGSQLPDFYMHDDISYVINQDGYWASYNVPYFKQAWLLAGYDIMAQKYGEQFTWDGAPRAKIFKQRQHNAVDVPSIQRLMRYNDWKNDPLSLGCPMNQLASRGDLSPPHVPLCYRNTFGAVNAKITSSSDVSSYRAHFTVGPTHDTQPVFSWTPQIEAEFPTAHYGQPKTFNFGWQVVQHP
jgi:hypothetical protein